MFTVTVTVTDPKLEKFAKHYEVALNRYFEEHPEMVEEVERLTAERIAEYWREMGFDPGVPYVTRIDPVELIDGMVACSREQIGDHCPVEVLPSFLAVSSGEAAAEKVKWIDLSVPTWGEED